jgi:hypothetical protein
MKVFLVTWFLSYLCLTSIVSAQNHPDLFEFYTNKQFDKLETRIQELGNSAKDDPEVLFFNTILTDNADNAITIYEQLFSQSQGLLKKLASEKLAEYYYALGFYIKSSEYEKYSKTYIPVKTTEFVKSGDNIIKGKSESDIKSIYMIQVGAFSVIDNANDLAGFLKGKELEVSVVSRNIAGNILYCVWLKGDSNFENTEKFAEEIKEKYDLSYRIVQP